MSASERVRIARLAANRSGRSAMSKLMQSRLLRWRYGSSAPVQLLIVPQDLRTADPSFWREIELGQFGLAGSIAELKGHSPFDLPPPNPAWERALHGFDWLRHLDAAGNEAARDAARELAHEWIIRSHSGKGVAWEPAVCGRRLISWLSHAALLLDGAEPKTYEAVTASLGAQVAHLAAGWRDCPDGYPRLLALTALVLADLTIAGREGPLTDAEHLLAHELQRQILPDGGHISRNPTVLIEIVLDLLPLRQCFKSRDRRPPDQLVNALRRIPQMLRFLRLGDGTLSRFNGVSVASPAGLATVLAYDDRQDVLPGLAPNSRYTRLSRGSTVVIADTGAAPPLAAASEAHAGCLSFEISAGTRALLINGGAPGPPQQAWRAKARSTASHNTLCLGDMSSSELIQDKRLDELLGAPSIKGPYAVEARVVETPAGGLEATATHDGYKSRYGLIHKRRLALSADGKVLEGTDQLSGARVRVRLRKDVPFAIHFHLHPEAQCRTAGSGGAEIVLKDGLTWRLTATGAAVSVEDSTFYADSAGPCTTLQIVLRGATFGDTEVNWKLEAVT